MVKVVNTSDESVALTGIPMFKPGEVKDLEKGAAEYALGNSHIELYKDAEKPTQKKTSK